MTEALQLFGFKAGKSKADAAIHPCIMFNHHEWLEKAETTEHPGQSEKSIPDRTFILSWRKQRAGSSDVVMVINQRMTSTMVCWPGSMENVSFSVQMVGSVYLETTLTPSSLIAISSHSSILHMCRILEPISIPSSPACLWSRDGYVPGHESRFVQTADVSNNRSSETLRGLA